MNFSEKRRQAICNVLLLFLRRSPRSIKSAVALRELVAEFFGRGRTFGKTRTREAGSRGGVSRGEELLVL